MPPLGNEAPPHTASARSLRAGLYESHPIRSASAVASFAVNDSQRRQPSDLLRLNEANVVYRNKRPASSSGSTCEGPARQAFWCLRTSVKRTQKAWFWLPLRLSGRSSATINWLLSRRGWGCPIQDTKAFAVHPSIKHALTYNGMMSGITRESDLYRLNQVVGGGLEIARSAPMPRHRRRRCSRAR